MLSSAARWEVEKNSKAEEEGKGVNSNTTKEGKGVSFCLSSSRNNLIGKTPG